jgi:hypothetical protein
MESLHLKSSDIERDKFVLVHCGGVAIASNCDNSKKCWSNKKNPHSHLDSCNVEVLISGWESFSQVLIENCSSDLGISEVNAFIKIAN